MKGKGVILDSNQQKISFILPSNIANLQCFAQVSFEIILTQEGLMAVNVELERQQKK